MARTGGGASGVGSNLAGRGGASSQQSHPQLTPQLSTSSLTSTGPGSGAQHPQHQHLQSANATFNSFIEDPSSSQWQNEIASAYNEVTGVPPLNYQQASVNSRQFQIAQQQAMKQRMMEQSKVISHAIHTAISYTFSIKFFSALLFFFLRISTCKLQITLHICELSCAMQFAENSFEWDPLKEINGLLNSPFFLNGM